MTAAAPPVSVPSRKWTRFLAGIWHRPLAAAALAVVLAVTVAVILAPLLAPHPPLAQDLLHARGGPSASHPLGTDDLGRDMLSRLLYGGRPALLGVGVAVSVYIVLGMSLGILAGYLRGWTDRVIVAVMDVMLSVPVVILMLAVLAIFSQSNVAAMFTLGVLSAAGLARIIRSSCIALREELFVDAAKVSGLGPARIMARHIFPSLVGLLLVQVCLFSGVALMVQTGLGFLGLATPAPAPSWGGMVGEASQVIQQNPSLLFITGGLIGLMSLSFGLLGDGLRDLTQDRRRGTSGRSPRPVPLTVAKDAVEGSETPPETGVLTVRDYSISFATAQGPRTVVDSVGFSVNAGEIFGLVGESGSGKTVTGLSLLGLLAPNGRVTGGSAWLSGNRISGLPERHLQRIRGREMALVSQEPMVALDPNFTIGSQLGEVVRRIGDVPGGKDAVRERIRELLTSVHLRDPDDVARRHPHELSGGMLQRVAIAMALAGSPKVLIADEPTTALDVTVQAGILDLLRSLRDDRGMAIILITHDLGVVADTCDRAIVMEKGRIVEEGSVEDIFYRPQHPYTKKLIESTPSIATTEGRLA
ncbi:dipeptide/oligopeptide/nickel ABC transporter permease/ATP-binding protein [Streptomyces turgidiscabies]|uniref:ABC transporter, ATP-binding protein n=1 Tax=Streptomyces turgidiscabies (strain Car8) TaxID=698760 RepID=L7F943_STRT8|nr:MULTISPECIES: dipeptide/oligopeptide/nickel ABC transporter permease/ATP-binding protein [Streptomyces]ELP67767.1 ABC transporter, ATP-binding protein [Streptomyces turgidiscabies Car8]MDX3496571.1 dipeptide/oligopeptide/nickel ABC transporter permease/ATP-binding protein [Streptomyces turgidiscabies]GAQ72767.1 oligopeptide transport ATP-binding protein OppD [Streptomyces turgidiscabies]